MQERHKAWEEAFAEKVAAQLREMCSDLRHRSQSHCKEFLANEVHAPEHPALHWPAKTAGADAATGVVVANRSLILSAHWSGHIPSVACIALIPESPRVESWMRYFVDNFRQQNYEGGKRLVMVYHHSDHKTAKLVKQYADGLFIKAAAARGEAFPSAAAARFGMWQAQDAEIVARWDFEAWHHPERLNTQVRALALSARPASLLARWKVLDGAGGNATESSGARWDGSLVGDSAWMRSYWYPFLDENDAVINGHAPHEVVSVDEPGLMVYDNSRP